MHNLSGVEVLESVKNLTDDIECFGLLLDTLFDEGIEKVFAIEKSAQTVDVVFSLVDLECLQNFRMLHTAHHQDLVEETDLFGLILHNHLFVEDLHCEFLSVGVTSHSKNLREAPLPEYLHLGEAVSEVSQDAEPLEVLEPKIHHLPFGMVELFEDSFLEEFEEKELLAVDFDLPLLQEAVLDVHVGQFGRFGLLSTKYSVVLGGEEVFVQSDFVFRRRNKEKGSQNWKQGLLLRPEVFLQRLQERLVELVLVQRLLHLL